MAITIAEYIALSDRFLDTPHDLDLRDMLLVCGDALESAGDWRGALIALGHAARTATGRRYQELRAAMAQHLLASGGTMIGELAPLIEDKRALDLDFRGGRLYGAYLDTRYVAQPRGGKSTSVSTLVRTLLLAPAAGDLRRLHVRVKPDTLGDVISAIRSVPKPRIEELLVTRGVRARSMYTVAYQPYRVTELLGALPHLWLCVLDDQLMPVDIPELHPPLPPELTRGKKKQQLPPKKPETVESKATRVRWVDAPNERAPRVLLGRALCSQHAPIRDAALDRLVELGERALVYLDAMLVLLEPGLVPSDAQARLASIIGGLGLHAAPARMQLASIAGRASYDAATRRAAGAAEWAIRRAMAS